jgi:hypothetical protein
MAYLHFNLSSSGNRADSNPKDSLSNSPPFCPIFTAVNDQEEDWDSGNVDNGIAYVSFQRQTLIRGLISTGLPALIPKKIKNEPLGNTMTQA